MKISIFGFGNVGQQLASLLSEANQDVSIATRDGKASNSEYLIQTFEQAAEYADAVFLAIPFSAAKQVLEPLAEKLSDKVVIDATNPLNADWSPLLLGQEWSAGEEIQDILPKSKVVKAFNTIFADVMSTSARNAIPHKLTAFVASDHLEAKEWVNTLITAMDFDYIDVGPMRIARYLESMAHLNIQIAVDQEMGTFSAFVYHH